MPNPSTFPIDQLSFRIKGSEVKPPSTTADSQPHKYALPLFSSRGRERSRERQTDTDTQTQTHTHTHRHTYTDTDTHRLSLLSCYLLQCRTPFRSPPPSCQQRCSTHPHRGFRSLFRGSSTSSLLITTSRRYVRGPMHANVNCLREMRSHTLGNQSRPVIDFTLYGLQYRIVLLPPLCASRQAVKRRLHALRRCSWNQTTVPFSSSHPLTGARHACVVLCACCVRVVCVLCACCVVCVLCCVCVCCVYSHRTCV